MNANETLQGIPAVRAKSALSAREMANLGEALADWRSKLRWRLSSQEYQHMVIRHVRITVDPGSTT